MTLGSMARWGVDPFVLGLCWLPLAAAQQPLPEVGLGSLSSGGQFYKDKLVPQLADSEDQYYMTFIEPAQPDLSQQQQGGWRQQDTWQQQQQPDGWQQGPDTWQQGADSWQEGADTWQDGVDTWQQAPDTWQQAPDTWQQAPDTWQQAPDTWQQAPDTWQQAPDTWQQAPDTWQQGEQPVWQQGVQPAIGAGPDVMVQDPNWQNTGCQDCGQPDPGCQDCGQPDTGCQDCGQPDTGCQDCGQPDTNWQEPGLGNSAWQEPIYEERAGPWLPGYGDSVQGQGWQAAPCSPEPPVFPAVYSCGDCEWLYQQQLPCWQQWDPCSQYYNCPPPSQPAPAPTPAPAPPRPPPTRPDKPATNTEACPEEVEVSAGGEQFLLSLPSSPLSWHEADARAISLGPGWQLATVATQQLARQLRELLGEGRCGLGEGDWLGGNSLAQEDRWVWVDGQEVGGRPGGMASLEVEKPLWGYGQPGQGHCMLLDRESWGARECLQGARGFLAQKVVASPTAASPTPPTTAPVRPTRPSTAPTRPTRPKTTAVRPTPPTTPAVRPTAPPQPTAGSQGTSSISATGTARPTTDGGNGPQTAAK